MPIYKCPDCEEEIDHIETREYVMEYGRADLTGRHGGGVTYRDWEHDEYGEGDELRYVCPECGNEIDLDDITVVEEEAEEGTADRLEEAPPRVPAEWSAARSTDGNNPLADFAFCSLCLELKQKEDLDSGKCEACRDE